jgi:hypothetical protein
MDDFDDIPSLFDPGQDLYATLVRADATETRCERFSRYNPAIAKGLYYLLSILRRIF